VDPDGDCEPVDPDGDCEPEDPLPLPPVDGVGVV
jgi:hypothetical protein